jgi:endonuclease-3
MSSFERDRFAIDTHIWRIAQRLGWIPRRRTDRKPTEGQADSLEERIPVRSRRHLHAVLVALGRDCCQPKTPQCRRCVLADVCRYGRSAKKTRGGRSLASGAK